MALYRAGLSPDCPLGKETLDDLKSLFEKEDFCIYFRINSRANIETQLYQLKYYFLEWHDSSKFMEAVKMFDSVMLYRRSRAITGTMFW